jgi:predicted patatin/cPLA2 family phospholipase
VKLPRRVAALAVGLAFAVVASSVPAAPITSDNAGAAYAQAQPKPKAKPRPKAKPKAKPQPQPVAKKTLPPRVPFTQEDQAAAVIPGFETVRVWGDTAEDFRKVLPASKGPWLAMSGGGADGAFAAGVLTGWTKSGNRPEFTVVTGVSIGALIAPYAFVGSKYDEELRQSITTITGADIFEDLATPESFLDTWPLRRFIEKRVTAELIAEIAAEHKKGRRLLVVTTNVDAGRRVLWDMGAIAEKGDDKALKLFRDVLMASSAIPGFFQPVMIDVEANGKKFQEMHIDGSVTSPFFVAPETLLEGNNKVQLPATELYIVVNGRLSPEFHVPERNTVQILARLIGVVLKAGLKAELMLFAANADRIGVPIKAAQIGDEFQHPAFGLFDEKYMNALYQYGVERASKGTAFEPLKQPALELRSGQP